MLAACAPLPAALVGDNESFESIPGGQEGASISDSGERINAMRHEQHDYVFIIPGRLQGQFLAEETCDQYEAAEIAQAFSQQYGAVLYAKTAGVAEPRKCENCGAILAVDYTCPDCGREE